MVKTKSDLLTALVAATKDHKDYKLKMTEEELNMHSDRHGYGWWFIDKYLVYKHYCYTNGKWETRYAVSACADRRDDLRTTPGA